MLFRSFVGKIPSKQICYNKSNDPVWQTVHEANQEVNSRAM